MPGPTPSPTRDATSTSRGLVGVGAQVFAGLKSFLSPLRLAVFTTAGMPESAEASIAYDSTKKRMTVRTDTGWWPVALSSVGPGAESLEEHLLSTAAHFDENIEFIGGSLSWADETPYNPVNSSQASMFIIDELSSQNGASRVGAEPGSGLSGTTVQAQLNELNARLLALE